MERLRQILIGQAGAQTLVTYKSLADQLGLLPPNSIHQLTRLLERLMAEDAAAGRPLLAALCVGRLRRNLPAPGFFETATRLGLYAGAPEGPEARTFHAHELARVFATYQRLPERPEP